MPRLLEACAEGRTPSVIASIRVDGYISLRLFVVEGAAYGRLIGPPPTLSRSQPHTTDRTGFWNAVRIHSSLGIAVAMSNATSRWAIDDFFIRIVDTRPA